MADGASLAVWRGDDHLAEGPQSIGQRRDPLRVNPVVVADEDEGLGAHDAAHVATKDAPLQPRPHATTRSRGVQ
jgi:hypothetical protein